MKARLFFLLVWMSCTMAPVEAQQRPRVIFDTDMGPDYDDVGAISLLYGLSSRGRADILATIASTRYEGVASVLDALNTYFQHPTMPVAVAGSRGLTLKDWQRWTDTIRLRYPYDIRMNSQVPDAVTLYRKLLARQPDTSVTIITVGFLTNIADLLQSPADRVSPLNGYDLVKKKVRRMVSMAGKFPSGKEFNVERDAVSSMYVFEHFPMPIILSGFEIGEKIFTGIPLVQDSTIQNSPVKDVFRICTAMSKEDLLGRKSWDETAVLVALSGTEPYYTLQEGRMIVSADGSNSWDSQGKGHFKLVEKSSPLSVQERIDEEMRKACTGVKQMPSTGSRSIKK